MKYILQKKASVMVPYLTVDNEIYVTIASGKHINSCVSKSVHVPIGVNLLKHFWNYFNSDHNNMLNVNLT